MQRTWFNGRRKLVFEILFSLLLIALIAVDQVTKTVAKASNESGWKSTTIIDGFFYFTYTMNSGAAWSFLADVSWGQLFFKILTAVSLVLFFIYYVYVCKRGYKFLRVAVILLFAGAIGNFIDRLAYNGVVDFISLVFGDYNFPIFNIADSYMTIAIIMIIIHYLFLDNEAIFKKRNKNANKDLPS